MTRTRRRAAARSLGVLALAAALLAAAPLPVGADEPPGPGGRPSATGSAEGEADGGAVGVAAPHRAAAAGSVWDREAAWPLLVADTTSSFVHAGGLLGQTVGGVPDYPLTDALGSVRARTDPAGAVTATTRYHPFGQPDTGTAGFGFAGEQTDPTGLVFLRARSYHPELGRLLTPDPLQPNTAGTQGWNLYTYTANNPTTWTDPTGTLVLIEYSLQGAATGAAIGAAGGLLLCDDTALSDHSPADTYPACVFRTTLAGAAGAVTVPAAGLWATLGTAAAGGLASNLTYQTTGMLLGDHHFDPRALLTDTALATITAGTLPAGTRTWHNLRRTPPQVADDFVDLASPARRTHILQGDASGGGHLWPGTAGKTPFPQSWSGDRIMHEISDIATDPAAWRGAVRQGSRTVLTGTRGGVDIRVIVDSRTGDIITGYPTNLPWNP